MNNEAFQESTPVGTVVYKLEGYDPEGGNVTFGLIDSGNFMVDPLTGQVSIIKALDREVSFRRVLLLQRNFAKDRQMDRLLLLLLSG